MTGLAARVLPSRVAAIALRRGDGAIFNRILLALPPEVCEGVLCSCHPVEFPSGHMIYRTGAAIENAYFVNTGLVCLLRSMQDGRTVEVGAVGAEGLVGVGAAFDTLSAFADFVVEVPVAALRISRSVLHSETSKYDALRSALIRYLFLQREQLIQVSACNRLHSLEQRCCHWLLVAHDNVPSDEFRLTHEFLALLLGVQRASVSMTANGLQKRGLIQYRHGRIRIMDRAALEEAACECYGTLRRRIERALGTHDDDRHCEAQRIAKVV